MHFLETTAFWGTMRCFLWSASFPDICGESDLDEAMKLNYFTRNCHLHVQNWFTLNQENSTSQISNHLPFQFHLIYLGFVHFQSILIRGHNFCYFIFYNLYRIFYSQRSNSVINEDELTICGWLNCSAFVSLNWLREMIKGWMRVKVHSYWGIWSVHIRCQNYRKYQLTSHLLIWRSVRQEQFKWEVISDSSITLGSTTSKFNLDEFWHI